MASKLTQNLTEATVVDKTGDRVPIYSAASPSELRYMTPDNLVPDASTTAEGKVEISTDAETITGTDPLRVLTPANLTAKMDTDGTLAGNSDTRIPSQKAVKTYADTKTTLATVLSTISSGWTSYSAVTPSYTSSDAPTYTITFSGVDLTSTMSVGMRVKLTDSTVKYFIITAIAFSTNTVVTLYGGTDYTLSGGALSSFNYSTMKAPLGFPLDPTKWTVRLADTSVRSGALTSPNYLNIGTTNSQLSMPIGAWRTRFQVYAVLDRTTAGTDATIKVALSTANNSASDTSLQAEQRVTNPGSNEIDIFGTTFFREKLVVVSSKTLMYLNMRADSDGTGYFNINGTSDTIIEFECAYL